MAERDYVERVAKKSGAKEQWDNYRSLKKLTNKTLKSAEALHYRNLKFNRFFATIGSNKITGYLPPADADAWKKYEPTRK